MTNEARKAAVAAYKERKVSSGIYAVRCLSTGQCWLGRAPDLATIQNRIWFTLRHGRASNRNLQAAWNAQGADSFAFEEIERLPEEASAYVRDSVLKERLAQWRARLAADAL